MPWCVEGSPCPYRILTEGLVERRYDLGMTLIAISLFMFTPGLATSAAPDTDPIPERPWTLMVYGAADNNADGPILDFLDSIRQALDDDPGMELLLFIDRSEHFSSDAKSLGADFTDARIYRLHKDSAELLDASEYFPGMGGDEEFEVDSADPRNVAQFVAFGKANFPARKYGLMIYSHADGCTMCPDEESGRSMSIPELTDWVDESASVDFLALELCNMAGVEIAYQWRPGNGGFSADVLVAIPNAGPLLDWDRAFARIRSAGHPRSSEGSDLAGETFDPATMTALEFGTLVVDEGFAGRRAMGKRHPDMAAVVAHEAAGCYDLTKVGAAKKKIDALAVSLNETGAKEIFEGLRGANGECDVMNYVGGNLGTRPYVDAFALFDRAAKCDELSDRTRAAAALARDAIDELVVASFGMEGLEGFVPGSNGIFLVFPDGDAEVQGRFGLTRVWNEMGWYTPLEADGEVGPYGRWAFLADGAEPGNGAVENWFELLDCWFDDATESPAGLNRYAY